MNKLLVILGPTSTGKTELALYFAKKFNGELISADSRQVYKGLDIGTGKKPSQNSKRKLQIEKNRDFWEIGRIKVWMYDVANPKQRFNLYGYILKAEEIVKKITSEKKLPILVGGTGLYIRSLIEGISDFSVGENKNLRESLEKLRIEEIRDKINPQVLSNLNHSEVNNKRRLIRILEKLLSAPSGKSFPGLSRDFDVLKIGLKAERDILSKRIKERVVKRIKEGMVEESEKLLALKLVTYPRMDELGLEYRYIAKYLKGEIKTEAELVGILSLKIRQFAKRQETWFKKEANVVWFDISGKGFIEKVEKRVRDWYN